MLGLVWCLGALGILLDIVAWGKWLTVKYLGEFYFSYKSRYTLYVAMGWACVPFIYSVLTYPGPIIGFWGFFWILTGGIVYTVIFIAKICII